VLCEQIPELVGYPALVLNLSILVDVYLNRVTYWDDPKASYHPNSSSVQFAARLVTLNSPHGVDRSTESFAPAAAHANPYHHADHSVVYAPLPLEASKIQSLTPPATPQTSLRSSPLPYPASMLSSTPRYAFVCVCLLDCHQPVTIVRRWARRTTCRSRSNRPTTTLSPWP
jgi:hypothetical protein